VLTRQLGKFRPNWSSKATRRAIGTRGTGRGRRTLTSLVAREKLDDLLADTGQVGAQADEDLGGDTLALAHEPEQHVLGADVVVAELQRLRRDSSRTFFARGVNGGDLSGRPRGPIVSSTFSRTARARCEDSSALAATPSPRE